MSNRSTEKFLEVKDRAFDAFRKLPGVHTVGLGRKEIAGHSGDDLAIRVFLSRKKPLTALDRSERIPPFYEGIPTDIVEEAPPRLTVNGIAGTTDVIRARTDEHRYRALRGGTQVQRKGKTAKGTMGCFATAGNRVFGLTNHHVVFDGPNVPFVPHRVGQPTDKESCSGCTTDLFGTLAGDANTNGAVDIVLIQLDAGQKWRADVEGVGNITGMRSLTLAEAQMRTLEMQKRGRSSGHTGGILWDFACNTTIAGRTYVNLHRIMAHNDPVNLAGP
ncbi:MAG TPA: hypothetical protein VN605_15280, partial [Thermoanaerobaculia bacterium]|nr:hypothetical protein [Thermoanaerobaculia bacterium]